MSTVGMAAERRCWRDLLRALSCTASLAACAAHAPRQAEPWPAADNLFQRDANWLGGDAVYSVDLGGDRILWLFGDSFIALDERRDRRSSTMVRNTLAVQTGRDPASAAITFHWRTIDDRPAAFFADAGPQGFWPLHGCRVPGGPLLLFQTRVRATPGEGLGFHIDGWRLLRIDNVDAEPAAWNAQEVPCQGATPAITFGTSVWCTDQHVVMLGTRGNGPHPGVLGRFARRDLDRESVYVECWTGERWSTAEPTVVLDDAGPECSLHAHGDGWLHVFSRGFGATTITAHTATAPHGPWSAPRELFVPPESLAPRAFVYAGKSHPALAAGHGWLAVSYAANAFEFGELFTTAGQPRLYWPRFWRVPTP